MLSTTYNLRQVDKADRSFVIFTERQAEQLPHWPHVRLTNLLTTSPPAVHGQIDLAM